MKTYEHVLSELYGKPWAILPEKLTEIRAFASRLLAGEKLSDEQIRQRIGAGPRSTGARSTGVVAVLPIYAVARNRGTNSSTVRSGFGQGRMVLAKDAVNQKMADRVGTLDQVLARFGVGELAGATKKALGTVAVRERELAMLGGRRASDAMLRERELALYQ